jgi:hypothetical protein
MASRIRKIVQGLARFRLPSVDAPTGASSALAATFYLLLFWQLQRAHMFGLMVLAVSASTVGPVVCVWFARIMPRIMRHGRGSAEAALQVNLLVVIIGAAAVSYVAFSRLPTGSWVTGIGSMGLMGPLLCVPTSLYSWGTAKRMTFWL